MTEVDTKDLVEATARLETLGYKVFFFENHGRLVASVRTIPGGYSLPLEDTMDYTQEPPIGGDWYAQMPYGGYYPSQMDSLIKSLRTLGKL